MGVDTHALSAPAQRTALEVLAANGVHAVIQRDDGVIIYLNGTEVFRSNLAFLAQRQFPTTVTVRPRTPARSTRVHAASAMLEA